MSYKIVVACVLMILSLILIPALFLVNPVAGSTGLYSVTYNPYAGVDWNTVLSLKTELHAHTILGGGGSQPYQVINSYAAADFDALGISDYNRLTWPWSTWEEYLTPGALSMVAIPNDQVSLSNAHLTAPFLTTTVNGTLYGTDVQSAINAIIAVGGLPIIASPFDMGFSLVTADSWTGFQGVEIWNPMDGKALNTFDFQLWDHLLTDPARAQKHIWGFAVDDSHDGDINQGWIVVYASQKNATSVKNSIIAGSFVAVVNYTNPINSITQVGNTLTVDTSSSIVWKADGQQTVGTSSTLDLDALGPGYTYVRAEVNGTAFTQPIFITQTNPTTIFSNGFEDGFASWSNTVVQSGFITRSSDTARSGSYSEKIALIHYYGDKAYANKSLGAAYKRINMRAYVNFSTVSTEGIMMGPLGLSSPNDYAAVVVRNFTSNKWGIRAFSPIDGEAFYWESGTSTLTTNRWHYIELEAVMSVHGFSTLWVDGAMKLNVTDFNFYTSMITSVQAGEYQTIDNLSTALKFYVDDVVVSDSYIGPIRYGLTVGVSGHGVTNATGTNMYTAFTNVTVLATPDIGYEFDYWLRNGTNIGSVNPCTINMTTNYNLTAVFSAVQRTLTVSVVGSGSTNVTGTHSYNVFTNVTVLATPDAGNIFDHWLLNGSSAGSGNPYTLNMTTDFDLTAVFTPNEYDLFVGVVGHGVTNVTGTHTYVALTDVPVLATPDSGYYLFEWLLNGSNVGSANPYTVSMIHNYNLTAVFAPFQFSLTVNVSGQGSTNATGTFAHDPFTNVTVLATPDSGYHFDHWVLNSSNVGSDNPYTINMMANFDLTAVFSPIQHALTVSITGHGSTNATGTHAYAEYTNITVLATPDPGWNLDHWVLNGTSYDPTASFTVNMTANYDLTAVFASPSTYLVVRGENNLIYYRGYNPTSLSWENWSVFPEGATADSPASAFVGNVLYVVVRGVNYGQIWFSYVNLTDNTFSGWTLLDGATPSTPVLTSNSTTLGLVVRGETDLIWYRFYDLTSEVWSDWTSMPDGATYDTPAATLIGGALQVVVRGVNGGQIWHSYVNLTDSTFSGWTLLSGATPSVPMLTSNSTTLGLVVRGETDLIWYRFYNVASKVWGDWISVPNGATPDTPAATLLGGTLQVVVRGVNENQIWHGYVNLTDNTFSGWTLLDGATPSRPILTN